MTTVTRAGWVGAAVLIVLGLFWIGSRQHAKDVRIVEFTSAISQTIAGLGKDPVIKCHDEAEQTLTYKADPKYHAGDKSMTIRFITPQSGSCLVIPAGR